MPRNASRSFGNRVARALLLVLIAGCVSPVWAGKAEPEPPGGTGADEKRPNRPVTEAPPPGVDTAAPSSGRTFEPLDWKNAIGVYVRYLFVTKLVLRPFLAASTQAAPLARLSTNRNARLTDQLTRRLVEAHGRLSSAGSA